MKIIDNIHLTINNINIRIEEINNVTPYSIGITMKEMLIINTDENWESHETTAIIYKLLQITKFGVYLKINEDNKNKLKRDILK